MTAEKVLDAFPATMTYGAGRLLQRYAMARLGLWTYDWANLLIVADTRARGKLEAFFAKHPERAGMQEALVERGLL